MKPGIIVIGASGHAKVCIELLRSAGEEVAFCVASGESEPTCLGVPILQGDEFLAPLRNEGYSRAFIAIGANRVRAKLAEIVTSLGYSIVNAISPSALISPSAKLGKGIAIMPGVVVNADAVIGDLTIINTGACVEHDCVIDSGAHLAPHCALAGAVHVGAGAFLGIGCKVIPDMRIGTGAIVGAGSVVVSDIPGGVTAVGVPAKQIKRH